MSGRTASESATSTSAATRGDPRRVGAALLAWALLVPLAHAPAYLIGERPAPQAFVTFALATVLAGLAWALWARTRALDALAATLEPLAPRLLVLAMAAHFLVSIAFARQRLADFADFNQLGLFSQSTWTLLHGHPYANTHETLDGSLGSHFGVHVSPTLLIVAPLYALWPSPLLLLGLQSLALSLIPLPLFAMLRPRVGGAAALPLALAVLAIPSFALAGPLDFRDASPLPVLLLGIAWAIETRRTAWAFALSLLALGCREDTALTVLALGAWAALRGRGMRLALGLAVLGIAWFAVATRVVLPAFWTPGLWTDPQRFFHSILGQWGDTPLDALRGMLARPGDLARVLLGGENLRYLYALLASLLLVPPFGNAVALVALPSLGLNLVSQLAFMRSVAQGYALVPLAFFGLATTLLAARLARWAPEARRAGTALAYGLVVLAGTLPGLGLGLPRPEQAAPPAAPAARVVAAIPAAADVYAPVALYPALANRLDFGCWWSTLERGRDPAFRGRYEWVVLWPASDPPGEPREAAFAESLATDPRFEEMPGFEPFVAYRQR